MDREKTLFAMDLAAVMAVEELAQELKKSTDNLLLALLQSQTGNMLYDDSTKLWWDGPTVIAEEFKKELAAKRG